MLTYAAHFYTLTCPTILVLLLDFTFQLCHSIFVFTNKEDE